MGLVAKRVCDKRILRLIRGFLTAGVLADGLVRATGEGTPQGGPLSPLLSNLLLDVLDKELERRGHRFVRYAGPREGGDCNIDVQSRRVGERVMASVERFLTRRLKLRVNSAKSAVARPAARKFLGFSFTGEAKPRRRIAPLALARLASRVRALTRRTAGVSLEQAIDRLSIYLTGWRGYFGFCQTPELLRNLEGWVRRRLRCLAWVQWRTGRRRYTALRQHGIGPSLAATTAAAARRHGPWRLSRHPASKPLCPTPSSPPAVLPLWRWSSHDAATEPPCTDPYARWWGRGGTTRFPPIPIVLERGSPDGWDGRAEPDLVRPRGTLVVSVISGTCSRLRQNTEPDSRGLVPGIYRGRWQDACRDPWVPTDQVRGLKAHGSSPATNEKV